MVDQSIENRIKAGALSSRASADILRETFIDKKESLHRRYRTNYKHYSRSWFDSKIRSFVVNSDLEDLAQQLQLLKLEAKKHSPGLHWSDQYKTQVVRLVLNQEVRPEPSGIEFAADPGFPRFQFMLLALTDEIPRNIEQQFYGLLFEGATIGDLARHYQMSERAVHNWRKSMNSTYFSKNEAE